MVQAEEKVKIVQANLRAAQSRQKSYFDKRRDPLKFMVGDHVYLRVSPTRGVQRFGVRGKLAPRYVGPYEIIEECGPMASTYPNSRNVSEFRPKLSINRKF